MVMKQVSTATTDRPLLIIVIILIITTLLGAEYIVGGFDMEADESTYLPDNEVVNAYNEISEKFGRGCKKVLEQR